MAIRLRGSVNWLESPSENDGNAIWHPYYPVQLAIVINVVDFDNVGRVYVEAGTIVAFTTSQISAGSTIYPGGYGSFGIELFTVRADKRAPAFYFEMGAMGTGATADNLPGKPIFANGFLLSNGVRF